MIDLFCHERFCHNITRSLEIASLGTGFTWISAIFRWIFAVSKRLGALEPALKASFSVSGRSIIGCDRLQGDALVQMEGLAVASPLTPRPLGRVAPGSSEKARAPQVGRWALVRFRPLARSRRSLGADGAELISTSMWKGSRLAMGPAICWC